MNNSDILLMDGTCGLCNRSRRFLEPRLNSAETLQIIPQQSKEGIKILSTIPEKMRDADSMVLIRRQIPYIFSSAGIRCLLYMKLRWKIFFPLLWLIPYPIRDWAYKIVARNRS